MELKRILAKDTRSANERAMQLYGDDVLVISTQKVGDQTELIVAVEALSESESHWAQTAPTPDKAKALRQEKDEVFAEIFGFVQRQELAQSADVPTDKVPVRSAEAADKFISPVPQPGIKAKTKKAVPKAPTRDTPQEAMVSSAVPVQALQAELGLHRECVEMLRQEVSVLRREMQLHRQVLPWQNSQELGTDAAYAAQEMTDLGVPAGIRVLLIDAIKNANSAKAVRSAIFDALKNHLSACVGQFQWQGIHALVGPTGSGKTHMVTRLAQMAAKKHGAETQAIISYADARPGAWSQLQVLAASSGVEVYRATNPETLAVLLDELKPRLGIWIDTPANARYEIDSKLIQAHADLQWHALAPLDASVTSLRRLQTQSEVWSSIMITKADEGASVWHWLQALSETPLKVSLMADSDQVKKPAMALNPEAWCELALADLKCVAHPAAAKPLPKTRPQVKHKPVASKRTDPKAVNG